MICRGVFLATVKAIAGVDAERVESATGEDGSWPAMAADMVKKMKEIKCGDIIGFSPRLGRHGSCWEKILGKIWFLGSSGASICPIS
jgi:hypothetical protein